MAMSMPSVVPVETEVTGASTPMTMWQECRGLTIRHRSQSPTSTMIADELMATAIQRWLMSNLLAALVIVEAISIAGVMTTRDRRNR
jgi:hypothetical protein